MLPLFVLADSDIDEEELKPIILKLKRKLRKTGKKRKKTSADANCSVECTALKRTPATGVLENGSANTTENGHTSDKEEHMEKVGQDVSMRSDQGICTRKCHGGVDPATETSYRNCHGASSAKRQKLEAELSKESFHLGKQSPDCCENCKHLAEVPSQSLHESHAVDVKSPLSDIDATDPANLVALDCEFVGVGPRKHSALGRCSIVDYYGNVVLDIYACPEDVITDYRTPWSGIRRKHMVSAVPFRCAQATILDILKDKIVIGHALFNDFRVLGINHPWERVRDTANYKPLREMSDMGDGQKVSLKRLAKALLDRDIQRGEHCSCEDARAALDLYRLVQSEWEERLTNKKLRKSARATTTTVHRNVPKYEVSYLGDEFWPSDLFQQSEYNL